MCSDRVHVLTRCRSLDCFRVRAAYTSTSDVRYQLYLVEVERSCCICLCDLIHFCTPITACSAKQDEPEKSVISTTVRWFACLRWIRLSSKRAPRGGGTILRAALLTSKFFVLVPLARLIYCMSPTRSHHPNRTMVDTSIHSPRLAMHMVERQHAQRENEPSGMPRDDASETLSVLRVFPEPS